MYKIKNQILGMAALMLTVVLFSCGSGKDAEDKKAGEDKVPKSPQQILSELNLNDHNDVYKLDSIPVVRNKDTAGMEEESKDSLVFSARFQEEANRLSRAEKNKDYKTIVAYVPPEVIKFYGTKENLVERLRKIDAENRVPKYEKVISGPVKKIAASKDDQGYASFWYCLMPVRSFYTDASGKHAVDLRWLGGEIDVEGKTVYFLDITDKSREKIMQVMPGLTVVLDSE